MIPVLTALLLTQIAWADVAPTNKAIPPAVTPAAPAQDDDIDKIGEGITIAQNQGQQDLDKMRQLQGQQDVQSQQQLTDARQDYARQTHVIQDAGDSHPQNAPINVKAGDAMISLGESKRSLPLLDRAIDVAARNGDKATLGHALFSRAAADTALKDYPSVVRDARRILDIDPSNQQAQMLISLYQGRAAGHGGGDIQTAMQPGAGGGLNGSLDGASDGSAAQNTQASASPFGGLSAPNVQTASQIEAARLVKLAAEKAGLDAGSAKTLLNQALAADPKNVPALVARARVENQQKDFSASLTDADNAAKLSPRSAEAYFLRAQAKQGLGYTTPDVAADYATARELDPTLTSEEVGALAGAGAAGSSSLAAQAVAARAKATSGGSAIDSLFAALPPERRKTAAAGLGGLIAVVIAAGLGFRLLRR